MKIEEIDRFCDLYEQRLQAGERPSVEAFMEECHLPTDMDLLVELRKLHREYVPEEATTEARKTTSARVGETPAGVVKSNLCREDASNRYELYEEIARGGMGAIIRCRDTQLGRDLAIKVLLDAHQDRPEIIQRFLDEARIAGRLQHPGIAAVHEMGTLSDGRPFFSMKLVRGKTLSSLLRERSRLGEDRSRFLGIFEQICQTLAYAHSRGVIHRDLKPSNVMVGAFGEVQVMDWGLAKTLRETDTVVRGSIQSSGPLRQRPEVDVVLETITGSRLGTPAYMAPEQARGEVKQVDERADVFGLGAILCEILTGRPPRKGGLSDVIRQAEEAKLDEACSWLEQCGADEELITLAKRCLSGEPNDRPANAAVLTQEIAVYLESVEERLRQAELKRAEAEARADEEIKRREAEADARVVLQFFQDHVLAAARPESQDGGLGHDVTIRAAVDAAEPLIKRAFSDRPQVEASIRFVLGESYLCLGQPALATRQFERSRELRLASFAKDHPTVLSSTNQLALAFQRDGKVTKAIELFEATVDARKRVLGLNHRDTLQSMNDLALARVSNGQYGEAIELLRETLELRKASFGINSADTMQGMNNLATAYWQNGDFASVPPLLQEACDRYRANPTFGPGHPDTLQCESNLGLAYLRTNDAAQGRSILLNVLARQQTRLPPDHPNTLTTMSRIAWAHQMEGQFDEAIALLEETLPKRITRLGEEHEDTVENRNNLALLYFADGKIDHATGQLESLRDVLNKGDLDHPTRLQCLNNLATAYRKSHRVEEALPLCLDVVRRAKDINHPQTRLYLRCLADCYEALEQSSNAVSSIKKLAQYWRNRRAEPGAKISDDEQKLLVQDLERLIQVYEKIGKFDEAAQWRKELEGWKDALNPL